ncbi:hypothetical protein [Pseudomonas sp. NFX98]|uniref:hypothetical protein n=1 Tax=Pseudomonas sp. NFX98 TaxID=3399122 RepID=UPI0039FC9D15
MDFDYHYLIAFVFAALAFFEVVTIRKLIKKLNDKIDTMDMRLLDMQCQSDEIAHEATAAKQVSLNAWHDAKQRHAEIISAIDARTG